MGDARSSKCLAPMAYQSCLAPPPPMTVSAVLYRPARGGATQSLLTHSIVFGQSARHERLSQAQQARRGTSSARRADQPERSSTANVGVAGRICYAVRARWLVKEVRATAGLQEGVNDIVWQR